MAGDDHTSTSFSPAGQMTQVGLGLPQVNNHFPNLMYPLSQWVTHRYLLGFGRTADCYFLP